MSSDFVGACIYLIYAVVAFLVMFRMERDEVLRICYKPRSRRDWSEICFAVGLMWPIGWMFNFVYRRRL